MYLRTRRALILGALTAALLVTGASQAAAGTGAPTAKRPPVTTAQSPLGPILVDAKGRTVYVFMADSPGTSTCTGQCLDYWPAVVAPAKLPAPASGVTGKLGSITRDDGTRQLTINGWPLYTYAGDTKAGMTSGQGSSGSGAKWWVVSPAGKKITKS